MFCPTILPALPHSRPRAARSTLAVAVLLLPALLATTTPGGAAGGAADPVIVAVIDSGIDPEHVEFDAGQIVGWLDLGTKKPSPYDENGHGTATASLVAGNNRGDCGHVPKISFAPGAKLLIVNVAGEDGSIAGDLDAAVRWSVEQGADVISMSIGTIVPFPVRTLGEMQRARDAGVLMVVSAGNGAGNFGLVPTPTWLSGYGNEPAGLSVGGGMRGGQTLGSTTGNTDPDVTSWSDDVCVAKPGGGYGLAGGTSFAAPLVAGMAATLIAEARAHGQDDSPDRIESLLVYGARNSVFSPYAREGMGFLLHKEFEKIVPHARDGTPLQTLVDAYDAQGTHASHDRQYRIFVEQMQRIQPALG